MIKKSDALASSSTFGLPVTRAVKIWRLSAVVCDHSDDFSVLTELHELGRLCALLVLVADHDAGQTTHHIQELKVQVRVQFQPALEIIEQRGASFDGSLATIRFPRVRRQTFESPNQRSRLVRPQPRRWRRAYIRQQ